MPKRRRVGAMAAEPPPPAQGPSRGRRIAARVLVWLGALFAVVALVAGYVRWQALDTDTVRATADELILDEDIRQQVAATLVDSLFTNVDVQAELEQRLPRDQQGLAGIITGAVRELADRAANQLLERPRGQQLWVDTVAFSHGQLINVLQDESRAVTTQGGAVFLDLRPLIVELGNRIPVVGRIAAQLPDDAGLIKVMDANQLETAQDITAALDFLGTWFWVVPLLLFAAGIWLAAGRRRLILRSIAWASIVAGVLVLVIRRVAGEYVVDSLATTGSAEQAARDAWNILTSLLADGAWTLIGLAVVVLIGVWFAGPTGSATAARRELAPFLARAEIAFGTLAVLFLLLVLWSPTAQTTRVPQMLALAVLLALGTEVLRRQTASEHPNAADVNLGDHLRQRFGRRT
jgi:hypothetical protein